MLLNQNTVVPFIAGRLVGGICGVTAALLLAPQSGEKTRSQIKDKTYELKDRTTDSVAAAGQQAQKRVSDWQEKGQDAVKQGQRQVAETVDQGKQRVADAVDAIPGS
jgi:gas vesicle protein